MIAPDPAAANYPPNGPPFGQRPRNGPRLVESGRVSQDRSSDGIPA